MKPRIYFKGGLWHCKSYGHHFVVKGHGHNIATAYRKWSLDWLRT